MLAFLNLLLSCKSALIIPTGLSHQLRIRQYLSYIFIKYSRGNTCNELSNQHTHQWVDKVYYYFLSNGCWDDQV